MKIFAFFLFSFFVVINTQALVCSTCLPANAYCSFPDTLRDGCEAALQSCVQNAISSSVSSCTCFSNLPSACNLTLIKQTGEFGSHFIYGTIYRECDNKCQNNSICSDLVSNLNLNYTSTKIYCVKGTFCNETSGICETGTLTNTIGSPCQTDANCKRWPESFDMICLTQSKICAMRISDPGAECVESRQCSPNSCVNGKCNGLALGAVCEYGSDKPNCGVNLYCGMNDTCETTPSVGQPCDYECKGNDVTCQSTGSNGVSTCQKITRSLKFGELCGEDIIKECENGYYCVPATFNATSKEVLTRKCGPKPAVKTCATSADCQTYCYCGNGKNYCMETIVINGYGQKAFDAFEKCFETNSCDSFNLDHNLETCTKKCKKEICQYLSCIANPSSYFSFAFPSCTNPFIPIPSEIPFCNGVSLNTANCDYEIKKSSASKYAIQIAIMIVAVIFALSI